MLMKLGDKDNFAPKHIGVWETGYSWCDEGNIHPITAKVFYTSPQFEVVDVTLDYDKAIDIPDRLRSLIVASVIEEYAHAAVSLKKAYEAKAKRSLTTDSYFEE